MEELFKRDSPSFPLKSLTYLGVVRANLPEVSSKIVDLIIETPGVANNPKRQGGWQGGTASRIHSKGWRQARMTWFRHQDKGFRLSI